jgi:hypothetical protein
MAGRQRAINYATHHWDTNNDGVPDGRQHNTYDIEFYGENPLCGIYYLAGYEQLRSWQRSCMSRTSPRAVA